MKLRALILGFLRPAGLDFASMGAGMVGGLLGMSNAHELPDANFNVPGNAIGADQKMWSALASIADNAQRNAGMVDPSIVKAYSNLLGIDLTPLIQAGALQSVQYSGLGNTAGEYGNKMQSQAATSFDAAAQQRAAGTQAWMTSMDPQQALHDRMQQQVVDASRSGQSARGIAMSPYGAGIENKAVSDFNMDWQNQQLSRQLAGLGGLDQSFAGANQTGAAGALGLGGSMDFLNMQPGYTGAAAQAPINAQQMAYGMPMSWADAFSQSQNADVLAPNMQVMNQIYPYLQMGQAGQIAQFNANMGRDITSNQMQQQSQYGLAGGGQSGTNTMSGNSSGAGNPRNWMGMMGGMGGM